MYISVTFCIGKKKKINYNNSDSTNILKNYGVVITHFCFDNGFFLFLVLVVRVVLALFPFAFIGPTGSRTLAL